MMRKLLALLLGILMMFGIAVAEETAQVPASVETTENYMIPRMFMSMFNEILPINVSPIRKQSGDEEADRLIETYSLTEYDADGECFYYGSKDWAFEVTFVFEKAEDVSPDNPCLFWYMILSDNAEENAWRLAMYNLNQMIAYTYRDSMSYDEILHYFQTVTLGDTLKLPDGYTLKTLRPDGADYVVFSMEPANLH